jgi:hypothetical protein
VGVSSFLQHAVGGDTFIVTVAVLGWDEGKLFEYLIEILAKVKKEKKVMFKVDGQCAYNLFFNILLCQAILRTF